MTTARKHVIVRLSTVSRVNPFFLPLRRVLLFSQSRLSPSVFSAAGEHVTFSVSDTRRTSLENGRTSVSGNCSPHLSVKKRRLFFLFACFMPTRIQNSARSCVRVCVCVCDVVQCKCYLPLRFKKGRRTNIINS